MKQTITAICLGLSLAILMSISGCGTYAQDAGRTKAGYEVILPDGTIKRVTWDSNKDQTGFDAQLVEDQGQIKSLMLHIDKSSTLESLANGIVQQQQRLYDSIMSLVQSLAPIAAAAAKAGS